MKVIGTFENQCFPLVETERLVLRQRTIKDAEDMYAYGKLEVVANHAGFPPAPSVAFYETWLKEFNQTLADNGIPQGYGITIKEEGRVIGSVDFNRVHGAKKDVLEMGYVLHPNYWGRGFVTEAAKALIEVGFLYLPDLYKILICCHGLNKRSQRVAEKLGFTLEARLRGQDEFEGVRCDYLQYGLLRSEWKIRKNNKK